MPTRARASRGASSRCVATMAGTGKFVVGGNWKCNGNTASITQLVKDLNKGEIDADVDVIVAPPMLLEHLVESGHHVLHSGHICGGHVLHRA